jgi:hypothetical protein
MMTVGDSAGFFVPRGALNEIEGETDHRRFAGNDREEQL